ncbi:MAG: acyl-CoA desaturase [Planctomycetota bacterium]
MFRAKQDGLVPNEPLQRSTTLDPPSSPAEASGSFRSAPECPEKTSGPPKTTVDWVRSTPFIIFHLLCLFALVVGVSWVAVGVAVLMYFVRMFAITGFYHRYFSHRSFKTSRFAQFLFAALGNSSVQRGPLWWAAHHRFHHRHSDEPCDLHSPKHRGFWYSHTLWFLTREANDTDFSTIKDFAKYPELRFLNKYDTVVPILLGVLTFLLGVGLEAWAPGLGTNGWQMLIWGFFISTVFLFHGTYTINSLSHTFGNRRFKTTDTSRNNFLLALITMGEGWHNNHHHYQSATRQGFYWWEIDVTFYLLKILSWAGIVWDLRPVPAKILEAGRHARA